MGDMPWTRQYKVPQPDDLDRLEERRKRRAALMRRRSAQAARQKHDAADADQDKSKSS